MSRHSRSISLVAILLGFAVSSAAAQGVASDNFRWYVGGQAGVFVYRTPNQSRGGIPMAGGHMLIKAHRGGLYLAVDEAFKKNQQSSYIDYTAGGLEQAVTFSDVRRYTFGLMAFPVRGAATPYFGIGGGIMNVSNPQPQSGGDPSLASDIGSSGFGMFIAGLQFRVGGVSAFGQYQIQTAPAYKGSNDANGNLQAEGRLISGTVHSLVGGIRVSLGSAREDM